MKQYALVYRTPDGYYRPAFVRPVRAEKLFGRKVFRIWAELDDTGQFIGELVVTHKSDEKILRRAEFRDGILRVL